MSSLGERAARSMGWAVVDKWGTRITSLLVLVVLGRILNPADFGLVALATAYVALANIFVDSGFGRSLVQKREISDTDRNTAFWTSVVIGLALVGITVLIAPSVEVILDAPGLAPILRVLSLSLLFWALAAVPAALLEREFRFKSLALRRTVGTLVGGIAAVVFALLGFGVWALVIQALLSSVVGLVILWVADKWRPRLEFSRRSFKDLRGIGFSVVGIEFLGFVNAQADKVLIGAMLSPTALGYYFLSMRVISIMLELFSTVFASVSLTTFSRLQHDREKLLSWFLRLTSTSSLVAIPFFAVAAATAPALLPFLFGEQWTPAVPLVQILALLGAVNTVLSYDRNLLLAVQKPKLAFNITLGQSILGVAFLAVAVPYGVTAAAIAVVLRQYLFWPVRMVILRRVVGLPLGRYFGSFAYQFATGATAFLVGSLALQYVSPHGLWPILEIVISAFAVMAVVAISYALFARKPFAEAIRVIRKRKRGPRSA